MGCLVGCAVDEPAETSVVTSAGMNMQGMNMQGMNMQGMNMQGMNMQGFAFDGATLSAVNLRDVEIIKGELVAKRGGQVVRGTALVGAKLVAHAATADTPPVVVDVAYRITAITAELAAYDPTYTGGTYLYTLEQYRTDTQTWAPACGADQDGRRVAIPIAATWNAQGDRVESATSFTFACTTGVIAKCYRWGYRPWRTGYGGADIESIHQTCTRVARADYCGNGTANTHEGTWINIWDRLPAPGPIQSHGLLPPLGMLFEAGWNTGGAVCLSRARWLLDDTVALVCPDRLIPQGLLGSTVCDTVTEVLGYDSNAVLFNESYLSLL
ncbi:MAG: ADYC domain-containing protein [Kofleriaceae bacterium]